MATRSMKWPRLFDVTSRTIRRDLKILDDIFGGLDVKRVRWGLSVTISNGFLSEKAYRHHA